MNIILIAGTLLGLTGAAAVACQRCLLGQSVWVFANALLFTYNAILGNAWMMLLFGTYEALTIFGIWNILKKK